MWTVTFFQKLNLNETLFYLLIYERLTETLKLRLKKVCRHQTYISPITIRAKHPIFDLYLVVGRTSESEEIRSKFQIRIRGENTRIRIYDSKGEIFLITGIDA